MRPNATYDPGGSHSGGDDLLTEAFASAKRRAAGDAAGPAGEDELREAIEQVHLALSAAGAGSWTWDLLRDELRFDRQILEGLGRPGDSPPLSFATVLAMVHPDDRAGFEAAVKRSIDTDAVLDHRFRARHADGSTLYLAVRGRVFRAPDGTPQRLVGVGLDHTNSFRAAEALRQSEEKLRTIAEQIPGVVFQFRRAPDGSFSFPYVSEGVRKLYGVTPDQVYADPQAMFRGIAQEEHADLFETISHAAATLETWHGERRFVRPDGTVVWLSASSTPTCQPDGSVIWNGWAIDVTQSRETALALEQSERRLSHLARQVPGAVYQYRLSPDGSHSFPYLNDRVTELYGVPLAEALADANSVFETILDLGAVETSIRRSAETLTDWQGEFRIRRRDGAERWLSARATPEREPDGSTLWHGWILDVTEEKQAESDRRAFEAKLQHAQKLESLGVLAGGIAHDFNNLLTGILGHADLALEALPEGSAVRENVLQMVTAARRAAELSKQMLAYSGKGRFTLKRLRLPELVTEMSHLLEVSISKRCALRRELDPATPAIEADPTQLRQVVMNLILNASDSIGDESGVIVVRAGVQDCDRAYLAGCYLDDDLPAGRYAWLEVEDTGDGMSPETVERIFEPFFTTKFAGRGLGLAAVLGIVRGHRGAIRIASEPGRGTVFRVLFPECGEPADALETPDSARESFRGRGLVLVVDDEATVRRLARAMLERIGFEVICAADGNEAIALLRRHADRVRAVVLDMTMHPLDGAATFRELRRVRDDVRVVLSSGYSEQDATRAFDGVGLAGFLQKPYRLEDLTAVMRTALGEE